jgi:indole-3-glycerol phosphate synthase
VKILTKNISILKKIINKKKKEVQQLTISHFSDFQKSSNLFLANLLEKKRNSELSIIAECKKRSPSAGILVEHYDPVAIAKSYQKLGAAALSVLTDEEFFCGSLQHLKDVSGISHLPILRKDFIIHDIQIVQSRYYGAHAVLLIASVLSESELRKLRESAEGLGMDALVEVHEVSEMRKAVKSGAKIIGINNRNLNDFSTDLNITLDVSSELKKYLLRKTKYLHEKINTDMEISDCFPIIISESAIHSGKDVELIRKHIDGILVGTSLLKGDKEDLFREFLGA